MSWTTLVQSSDSLNTEWAMDINGDYVQEVLPTNLAETAFKFEREKYVVDWSSTGSDDRPSSIVRTADGTKLAPVSP